MAYICDNCGKGMVYGQSRSHHRGVAGKRWKKRAQATKRTFKPNLQKIAVSFSGVKAQMRLCTDCISRFKKEGKIVSTKFASI